LANFLDKIFRNNPFNNPAYPMNAMNVNTFLETLGGWHKSDSGEIVTPHTAMHTATVFACVKIISEKISTIPLFMYQLDGNSSRTLASDHDYFDLICNRPNPEQDAIQFRTAVMFSLLLWGNGYIELQRDNANRIVAMWHRHASRTGPYRKLTGELAYMTSDSDQGTPREIKAADMIHLMGGTFDGYIGVSPITYAKSSIGSNIAMDKFGGRFFANNATPQMALLTKMKVKPEVKAEMRTAWEALQSGSNQHRVAILDNDVELKQMSISQSDSQFLESKMASKREIAAMYGVPGHMVGDVEKGIKANVEQQAQDFLSTCLEPWLSKWEKALTCKLFAAKGRSAGRHIVQFDTRKLLRPDAASRQSYYQSMIQNGVLSPNEVRDLEQYNSIGADGDGHYIQLNMQSLALANSTDPTPNGPDLELGEELESNSLPKRLGQNYRGLFKDGVQRILKSGSKDYKNVYRCLWPTLDALATAAQSGVSTSDDNSECTKAVEKLLKGMSHRAEQWTDEQIEQICTDELKRVAKSLIFAVHADQANEKARKIVAQLDADDAEQENVNE
jgi:HK97 family phage portal protein